MPTGNLVEALIERANRLREDMMRSSLQRPTIMDEESHPMNTSLLNQNNNNDDILNIPYDNIDQLLNNENMCDMLGIKPSRVSLDNLNKSNDSIVTDLDGLENEQSLLDELLYGNDGKRDPTKPNDNQKSQTKSRLKRHPHGKPPSGRSPSPNITRVGGLVTRSRSTRSRSLGHSSDSDTASRVSFDMPSSDLDDSGNGKILFFNSPFTGSHLNQHF